MKKLFLLLFVVMLTSACTLYHIDSLDTSSDFNPPKAVSSVDYVENVTQPHEVIGEVIVNAERRQYMSEVMHKMKREAGMMGGNAITGIQTDATGTWKKIPPQKLLGNAYVRANFIAKVIVIK